MAEALALSPDARSTGRENHQPTGAAPRTTTLIVENMVCGGCMRKVEETLRNVAGVREVRANLSAKRVLVTADAATADALGLVNALADAGYDAAELIDDGPQTARRHEQALLRRVAVAGFAAANIMLLSVSVWSGEAGDMGASVKALFHWLSAIIALPAVAYAGTPFYASALTALRARRLNMDVPISLAVLLATGMSVYQAAQGSDQVYFDAAVTLLFFLLLGRFLDTRMRVRARGAAANLLGLRAMTANVVSADGAVETVSARDMVPGMRFLVAPGERIAADGTIVTGQSDIDESLITGESAPRPVSDGGRVFAGSINLAGQLTVSATETDENTLLSEVGRLMSAAEQARGRYVRLADRAASIYAPAVHLLGLVTVVAWLWFGAPWYAALTAGIATLIVTCPCALALAVPAVQVAASSRLFASGVLLKTPDALERLADTDTIVFDKTGTLTLGVPKLKTILNGDVDDLAFAARLAIASRHPFSRALVQAARGRDQAIAPAGDVEEMPGCGLAWETPQGTVRLGSSAWCRVDATEDSATAALWLCRPGRTPIGFVFEECLRADAGAVVQELAQSGFDITILSGDRIEAVRDVAEVLKIDHWHGRQSPADKIDRIELLRRQGHRVLMVGDGLNDAPALAAAHASLSPASAADVSQTTADAIFQRADLRAVGEVITVARQARHMALQNFGIALAYNAIFVPLAMFGILTPFLAAIAMSASSIGVTANALRLRHMKLRTTL